MTRRFLTIIALFSALAASSGCSNSSTVNETRFIMDTIVNIKVVPSSDFDSKQALEEAFAKIEYLGDILSKYNESSEVASINRLRKYEKLNLTEHTAAIVKKSLELGKLTDGAFDITISPLVDLWASYKNKKTLPPDAEIKEKLALVGFINIVLNKRNIYLLKNNIAIDLSGIAKGYAVDQAVKALKDHGARNALVDAGGDIFCLGPGPENKGWLIGVRNPRDKSLIGSLVLSDKAVATSGDYQRYFILDGKRYSHIIDPRTGYPVSDKPVSVTVVANDCATADGFATAISLLGLQDGLDLAEKTKGVEALIISEEDDSLKVDYTSGMEHIYESL